MGISPMRVVQAGDRLSARICHSRLNPCDAGTAENLPNLEIYLVHRHHQRVTAVDVALDLHQERPGLVESGQGHRATAIKVLRSP